MSLEQRLAEAVKARTEATPVPSFDVISLREQARHRVRRGAAALVGAAAVLVLVGAVGGITVLQRAAPPAEPAGGGGSQAGIRAFVDHHGGVLHLDGTSVGLATVPGLAETGLAFRGGVAYQTPDQAVRIIDGSGRETVLAAALGPPPAGFTPSVAYDAELDVVVALRRTGDSLGRHQVSAYAASTGERIVSTTLPRLRLVRAASLAGATDGVAALNIPGASLAGPAGGHIWSWTWTPRAYDGEWRRGWAFDLANRVVLTDWRPGEGYDPRLHEGGWSYVEGRAGERLDPTGAWRVDSTWQPWPAEGPVERSTTGEKEVALPELPAGSRVSLSYDTDGSVLAAVASGAGDEDVTRVFDCDRNAEACEPVGQFQGATRDPVFLAGAKP